MTLLRSLATTRCVEPQQQLTRQWRKELHCCCHHVKSVFINWIQQRRKEPHCCCHHVKSMIINWTQQRKLKHPHCVCVQLKSTTEESINTKLQHKRFEPMPPTPAGTQKVMDCGEPHCCCHQAESSNNRSNSSHQPSDCTNRNSKGDGGNKHTASVIM